MEQLKPTKFDVPIEQQWDKIIEEEKEALDAWFEEDRRHFLEELCDVQVAIETLKVHNFTEEEIAAMHEYVNKKNKKRGYFK